MSNVCVVFAKNANFNVALRVAKHEAFNNFNCGTGSYCGVLILVVFSKNGNKFNPVLINFVIIVETVEAAVVF